MTSVAWETVKDLFYEALREGPGRRAHLLEACAGDGDLRGEVESLLAAYESDPGFIEAPLLSCFESRPRDPAGRARLGRYRLERPIGFGGMGAVWLAQRADEAFEKRVAVKLLRTDALLDDPRRAEERVRRFHAERQVLADLDHPNIARLLDGGTSEDGVPYLVMDYIDGQPVDDYCREHSLGVRERLALFCAVCEAVHHAHQRLVVHRDLKPGNILITPAGVPRLLDFGIATLLGSGVPTSAHPMTPQYASPEQLRGEPVSTASDIYSLGVVLYELLAGVRPFQARGSPASEAARSLVGGEPARPSALAPPELARGLAGDVDAIVLKALRARADERYSSAAELRADIRRHLEGFPVLARRGTLPYRAARFVRRHRLGVGAAGLVLLALSGGLVAATRQARRADREAETAVAATRFLVDLLREGDPYAVEDPPRPGEADPTVSAILLRRARERVWGELADQPAVQAVLLQALGEIHTSLGYHEEAEKLLAGAERVARPGSPDLAFARANALLERGEHAAAVAAFAEVLARDREALEGGHPDLALDLNNLALALKESGDLAAALVALREALEICRRGPAEPAGLALLLTNHGALLRDQGEHESAQAAFDEALGAAAAMEEGARRDFTRAAALANAAELHRRRGDRARAETELAEALALFESSCGSRNAYTARALNNLGLARLERGDHVEAESLLRRSLDLRRALLGPRNPEVATSLTNLGLLAAERKDLAEAERCFREALEVCAAAVPPEHPLRIGAGVKLAITLFDRGAHAEARPLLEEALERQQATLTPDHPELATTLAALGAVLTRSGEPDLAEPLLREAWEIRSRPAGNALLAANVQSLLGECLLELGRPDEAEPLLRASLGVLEASLGPAHARTGQARERLAVLLEQTGRSAQAAELRARAPP
jgi:serine/threonine-protein kinase